MFRLVCALSAGGVVTVFAFLLVTGEYINDGPVVLDVSYNHGLHKGDLFVMAGWAVAMLSLIVLLTASRRRGAERPNQVALRRRTVPGAASSPNDASAHLTHFTVCRNASPGTNDSGQ